MKIHQTNLSFGHTVNTSGINKISSPLIRESIEFAADTLTIGLGKAKVDLTRSIKSPRTGKPKTECLTVQVNLDGGKPLKKVINLSTVDSEHLDTNIVEYVQKIYENLLRLSKVQH